jgi:hypothetical protein
VRLLSRRSKLTSTGRLPKEAGISPEKPLKERFKVPVKAVNSVNDSGNEPLRKLEDKSQWINDLSEVNEGGRGPEREL